MLYLLKKLGLGMVVMAAAAGQVVACAETESNNEDPSGEDVGEAEQANTGFHRVASRYATWSVVDGVPVSGSLSMVHDAYDANGNFSDALRGDNGSVLTYGFGIPGQAAIVARLDVPYALDKIVVDGQCDDTYYAYGSNDGVTWNYIGAAFVAPLPNNSTKICKRSFWTSANGATYNRVKVNGSSGYDAQLNVSEIYLEGVCTCKDGVKDNGETDVDCGGPTTTCSTRCANGKTCQVSSDCSSGYCSTSTYTCAPPCTAGMYQSYYGTVTATYWNATGSAPKSYYWSTRPVGGSTWTQADVPTTQNWINVQQNKEYKVGILGNDYCYAVGTGGPYYQ